MEHDTSHNRDDDKELPTAKKLFKQAGELVVLYGKIEDNEKNGEAESFHHTFVLGEDAQTKKALDIHGLQSIRFVPSYISDGEPTFQQAIFTFLPQEGTVKDIVIFEDGEVDTSSYPEEDDYMPNDVADFFKMTEEDEVSSRAIENIFGAEGRKYFDERTVEKEAWLHLFLTNRDELSVEDALELKHMLEDVAEKLRS